mmetsp:Transcript_17270/g.56471  ORF Transcript_17270/g.56471 Transcript_17270/m.56471 type:complete len:249 (-) Transcript_17270:1501-2247(-)|eukprot:scaffold16340_cov126-Isochrysis_galbana.AAC.4
MLRLGARCARDGGRGWGAPSKEGEGGRDRAVTAVCVRERGERKRETEQRRDIYMQRGIEIEDLEPGNGDDAASQHLARACKHHKPSNKQRHTHAQSRRPRHTDIRQYIGQAGARHAPPHPLRSLQSRKTKESRPQEGGPLNKRMESCGTRMARRRSWARAAGSRASACKAEGSVPSCRSLKRRKNEPPVLWRVRGGGAARRPDSPAMALKMEVRWQRMARLVDSARTLLAPRPCALAGGRRCATPLPA